MQEKRARLVVDALRDRGVDASLAKVGVYHFAARVTLPDGREAIWDSDGTARLQAQVMRNGVLVGYVPVIAGSEHFELAEAVEAIAATDYSTPVARRMSEPPPPAAPLPRGGGVFRRFFEGFR